MWCLCQGLGPSKSNSACRETVIPRVLAPTPPSTRFIQVRVTKKRHDRPPDVESGHPPLSHTCHPGQVPNCPKSGKNSKFRLFPIRSQMPPNAMKRRKTSPKRRFQLPFPTNSSLWHHLGTPRRSPRTSVQSNPGSDHTPGGVQVTKTQNFDFSQFAPKCHQML